MSTSPESEQPVEDVEPAAEPNALRSLLVNAFKVLVTLAIVVGMSVADVSQNAVANLGWTDIRMPAPVFAGFSNSIAVALVLSQTAGIWQLMAPQGSTPVVLSVAATATCVALAVRRWRSAWVSFVPTLIVAPRSAASRARKSCHPSSSSSTRTWCWA